MNSEWKLTTPAALILPLIIFFLLMKKKWKKSGSAAVCNLPPGPKKLPIIGNLHLISEPPFRCFRDLAKQYGPIMHLKLGEVDTIVVSSPEIAKEILKDNDPIFANRPESIAAKIFWYNYIDIAFSPYGNYWRQMRKICITQLLGKKSVRSMASIRKDEVFRLIDSINRLSTAGSTSAINLTEMVFSHTSSVTCRSAFGMVCKDKDALAKLVTKGLDMAAGFAAADLFPSSMIAHALSWATKLNLMRMRRKLDLILDDIIHKHENNGKGGNGEFGDDDLVDVLLKIKESGEMEFPIGYDNIKAVISDMFSAGTDTSSSTADWAMVELLRNPRAMAKAQAEVRRVLQVKAGNHYMIIEEEEEEEEIQKLDYLKLVIMETLRLHPQGSLIPRVSREQREISGYTLPEKVKVLVNAWAIHRDPNYWEDPETFEPERFINEPSFDITGRDFRYLPFGSGRRVCPGITFAATSVSVTLAHLLYNFNWKLPDGVDAQAMDMMENTGLSTYRKQNLFIIATPYQIE